jgi:hypothetical protein
MTEIERELTGTACEPRRKPSKNREKLRGNFGKLSENRKEIERKLRENHPDR